MDKNLEQMQEYVNQVLYNQSAAHLDPGELDPQYREFSQTLVFLGNSVIKAYEYAGEMADGILDRKMDRGNPLLGPLKDLQAKLSHITWQTMQVAKGNFNIQIQYLGEFSKAFKIMVSQLSKRAEIAKRNAEMEKQILETEKQLLEQEMENQVYHYKSLVHMNKEIRGYQHDIKNHLLCLGSLLEEGSSEKAKQYLKDITNQVYHDKKIIHTDNYILDALLSEKAFLAKEKKIRFTVDLNLKKEMEIQPADWCAIFGNALDNAIEACDQVTQEKRFIHVTAISTGSLVKIKIENAVQGAVVIRGNGCETTKKRKDEHGYGLANIEKAVKHYDGIMELTTQKGIFIMQILLCNVMSKAI